MPVSSIKKLNLKKLQQKNHTIVSGKKALNEVLPFQFSEDVINGKIKIIVDNITHSSFESNMI